MELKPKKKEFIDELPKILKTKPQLTRYYNRVRN